MMRWGRLIFLCGILLIVFCLIQNSINSNIRRLKEEETDLRMRFSDLQEEQNQLELKISKVGTDSYIESKAREDYQFLKEGELRFEFVNPQALYEYTEEEKIRLNNEMKAWQ